MRCNSNNGRFYFRRRFEVVLRNLIVNNIEFFLPLEDELFLKEVECLSQVYNIKYLLVLQLDALRIRVVPSVLHIEK